MEQVIHHKTSKETVKITAKMSGAPPKTGVCSVCRRRISLTKEAHIRSHGHGSKCPGSHKPPSLSQPTNPQAPQVNNQQHVIPSEQTPDKHFGLPVRTIRFLPRDLIPLAAEELSAALRAISLDPSDCSHWWNLLLWPRRLAEADGARTTPQCMAQTSSRTD